MKRTRQESEEIEEEKNENTLDPVFGQHRALPISAEVLQNVVPGTVPTDAETYLALVRKEALEGSSVMFIKQVDYEEGEESEPSVEVNKNNDEKIKEFNVLLDKALDKFNKDKEEFPEIGTLAIPSSFQQVPSNYTQWHRFFITTDPTVELVSNFDQELTLQLLVYLTKQISNKVTKPMVYQWIRQLLLRLPLLLESKDVATLRSLGQRASNVWSKETGDDTTKDLCVLVLAVVSKLYGQRDLATLR